MLVIAMVMLVFSVIMLVCRTREATMRVARMTLLQNSLTSHSTKALMVLMLRVSAVMMRLISFVMMRMPVASEANGNAHGRRQHGNRFLAYP